MNHNQFHLYNIFYDIFPKEIIHIIYIQEKLLLLENIRDFYINIYNTKISKPLQFMKPYLFDIRKINGDIHKMIIINNDRKLRNLLNNDFISTRFYLKKLLMNTNINI